MAGSKTLSFQDGLVEIMGTLGRMAMAPDADQAFVEDMQKVVVAYQKSKQSQMQGQQQQGQPGQPGQQSPAGPSPAGGGSPSPVAGPGAGGPPQGPPQQPGPGGIGPGQAAQAGQNGVMARPQMPNPDELRRILQTQAGS